MDSSSKNQTSNENETSDDTFNSGKFKIEYKSNNEFIFNQKEIDVDGKVSLLKRFQKSQEGPRPQRCINTTDEEDSLKM